MPAAISCGMRSAASTTPCWLTKMEDICSPISRSFIADKDVDISFISREESRIMGVGQCSGWRVFHGVL